LGLWWLQVLRLSRGVREPGVLDAERPMRLQWQEPGSVDHELIWGSIALAGLIAFTVLPMDRIMGSTGYRCPFRAVTGLPCPACGGTRALVAMGSFDLSRGFALNPLVATGWCFAVFYVPYALFVGLFRRRRLRVTGVGRRQDRVLALLLVCVMLANWAYLLARW
jgi:hypothetical protein